MQFDVHTFLAFFAVSGYLLIALAVIGAPVKLLLGLLHIDVGRAASAPVIGVAIVVLGSWYWALPQGATKPFPRIALVIGVVALLVWAVWRLRTRAAVEELLRDARLRQSALLIVICFFGVGATMVVNYTQIFMRDRFTVLSAGNNDAASYALEAQHMLDDGPRDPGGIVNYHAGVRSLGFSTGAIAALAATASVSDQDVWRVMQPTMFVTIVLGAYATATLLAAIFRQAHTVAVGVAAVLGFSVLYTTYIVGNWFFAQLLAIALVTTIATIVFLGVRSTTWRDRLGAVGLLGVLLAAGLAVYPHMVIMGSIVVLPIAGVAHESVRHLLRRAVSAGVLFAAGCAVAVVMAPGLLSDAIDITRDLEGVEAGWSLPSIYPTEMLGFQTSPTASQGWATVAMSALVLCGLVAAAVIALRRGLGASVAPLLAGIAPILVSYAIVYWREGGPTYRQWKWITFFIPLVVAFVVALFLLVPLTAPRRTEAWRRAGYSALAAYAIVAVFVFAGGAGFPLRSAPTSFLSVTPDEIDLSVNPGLRDVPAVHINTDPYWETMWLAYFLRDKQVSLAQETYYGTAPPVSAWYVERIDRPLAPGAEATPLNDTYRLVHMP